LWKKQRKKQINGMSYETNIGKVNNIKINGNNNAPVINGIRRLLGLFYYYDYLRHIVFSKYSSNSNFIVFGQNCYLSE
jgi:hypothetical protein